MSRTSSPFRQSDVTKALKGVRAAGHEPKAIKITPESITIEIGIAEDQEPESLTALEEWRRQQRAHQAQA